MSSSSEPITGESVWRTRRSPKPRRWIKNRSEDIQSVNTARTKDNILLIPRTQQWRVSRCTSAIRFFVSSSVRYGAKWWRELRFLSVQEKLSGLKKAQSMLNTELLKIQQELQEMDETHQSLKQQTEVWGSLGVNNKRQRWFIAACCRCSRWAGEKNTKW